MNLGQMLLVLLAIVLMTTIVLTLNNSFRNQVDMAVRNVYFTQGVKIADHVFQRYEAQLISDRLTFDNMRDQLSVPGGFHFGTESISGAVYNINVLSVPSDLTGNPLPLGTLSDHQRVTVSIRAEIGDRIIEIGTGEFPFTKVFSR